MFADQPPKHLLSIYENIWLDKLNATISINKMLLPSSDFVTIFLFLKYCFSVTVFPLTSQCVIYHLRHGF